MLHCMHHAARNRTVWFPSGFLDGPCHAPLRVDTRPPFWHSVGAPLKSAQPQAWGPWPSPHFAQAVLGCPAGMGVLGVPCPARADPVQCVVPLGPHLDLRCTAPSIHSSLLWDSLCHLSPRHPPACPWGYAGRYRSGNPVLRCPCWPGRCSS